jgi:hypothetical protein
MNDRDYILNGNYQKLDALYERLKKAEDKLEDAEKNVIHKYIHVTPDLWYEIISSISDKDLLTKVAKVKTNHIR